MAPEPIFVVAMEYLGADVEWLRGAPRVPVREHAYDVRRETLVAHDGHPPRYAFPVQRRGWATEPEVARCQACDSGVTAIVAHMIGARIAMLLSGEGCL